MTLMILLNTERLVLREFREEDWPLVHRYASDPRVVEYTEWGPNTEQQTRQFVRDALAARAGDPRAGYLLAVTRAEDGLLVGDCGLTVGKPENREAMLGYAFELGSWGRGYGTEAARAVLTLGFGPVGLHRVYATCDVLNVASWRVMEKLGMRREGRLREHVWQRGRWRDSYVYGILANEWHGMAVRSGGVVR